MLFARGPVLIVFSYGKALSFLALQLEKPMCKGFVTVGDLLE